MQGESAVVLFPFTNTGKADLIIEIVTSYKCTDITYPRQPIPSGGKGIFKQYLTVPLSPKVN